MKDFIIPAILLNRCGVSVRRLETRCDGAIPRPAQRCEFLTRVNKFRSFQLPANENRQSGSDFQDNKTMKTKSIATIATLVLLPIAAFAQPNPPTPPNPPPGPPPSGPVGPGGDRDRHEKKVPVTYLGVETSDVPRVVSEQLGLAKGFGLVVDYVVPDGPAAAAGVQQNDVR